MIDFNYTAPELLPFRIQEVLDAPNEPHRIGGVVYVPEGGEATNSDRDEPKRCPFCGGEASRIAAHQRDDGMYYPAMCGCRKCRVWRCGDSNYGHGGFATKDDFEASMDQAVARWNTRTPEQAIADEPNTALEGSDYERMYRELTDAVNELQKKQPYCYNPDKPVETLQTVGRFIDELNAILGGGKLTAEQVREVIERGSAWVIGTISCRYFDDDAYETIADELNAMLGGGECEMVTSGTPCEGNTDRRCTLCGAYGIGEFYDGQDHIASPRFCPNCGKAVKR